MLTKAEERYYENLHAARARVRLLLNSLDLLTDPEGPIDWSHAGSLGLMTEQLESPVEVAEALVLSLVENWRTR